MFTCKVFVLSWCSGSVPRDETTSFYNQSKACSRPASTTSAINLGTIQFNTLLLRSGILYIRTVRHTNKHTHSHTRRNSIDFGGMAFLVRADGVAKRLHLHCALRPVGKRRERRESAFSKKEDPRRALSYDREKREPKW